MNTWLRNLKNKYHWRNKIRVSQTSTFVCEGNLVHAHIKIKNSNNVVTVGKNTQLMDFDIFIEGEDNQIALGADCVIEGNLISGVKHLAD